MKYALSAVSILGTQIAHRWRTVRLAEEKEEDNERTNVRGLFNIFGPMRPRCRIYNSAQGYCYTTKG
jgi:hypothetical protein